MYHKSKWITIKDFANLEPINVFHKQKEIRKIDYDTNLLNSHVLFRKKFKISSLAKNYSIDISADDYYRLYVNGNFVCSGPAPGYPWHYYYNTVDITKYIKKGENLIAIHTFYQGLINRVWVSGDRRHGMICSIRENNIPILFSDETFKCKRHSGYSATGIGVDRHDTFFNEKYISGSPEENFELIDYDDSNWDNACIKNNNDYNLYCQETDLLDYYEIKPQKLEKTTNGIKIDIGQEIVGFITMTSHGEKDEEITIKYSEELDENGNIRSNTRCNCKYEDTWILSGSEDKFKPFDYKAFRYVEIIAKNNVIKIDSIKIIVRHYPFSIAVTCNIPDPLIQKVWDLCTTTIKYGTQECFIDCPTREKGQYLGDVLISAVSNAILTGNTLMLKKSIQNFADSSKICPGLMAVSTCSLMQEIADYSLLFPLALLWYFELSHDKSFLFKMIPTLVGLRSYFKKYERDDGLIINVTDKWNLVDWPSNYRDGYQYSIPNQNNDECHNVINAFYIGMLKSINKIFEICSIDRINITSYEDAFNEEFFNDEKNIYVDCSKSTHSSLHSNVLPLFFNFKLTQECKNNIIELISEKGLTSSGTYFSYFIMQALKNENQIELLVNLIKSDKAWINMINEDATTTFEAWGKEQKKNTSLFHPWSCSPIMILYNL